MLRVLFGLFLIAHGLVHAAVYVTPRTERPPFDPGRSWLLSPLGLEADAARSLSVVLAVVILAGSVLAGFGMFSHQGWWRPLAITSAAVSLLLLALYFHAWLTGAVLLDVGILWLLMGTHWPPQ